MGASSSKVNLIKIGAMLKQARLGVGLTQKQVAEKLHTRKSAISRIENHTEDIRLSTLNSIAEAVGKCLRLEVAYESVQSIA